MFENVWREECSWRIWNCLKFYEEKRCPGVCQRRMPYSEINYVYPCWKSLHRELHGNPYGFLSQLTIFRKGNDLCYHIVSHIDCDIKPWNYRVIQRFQKILLNSLIFFWSYLFKKILDIFLPGFLKGNRDRNISQKIPDGCIFIWVFENRNSYRKIRQEIPRGFLHGTYQQEIPQEIFFPAWEKGVRASANIFI